MTAGKRLVDACRSAVPGPIMALGLWRYETLFYDNHGKPAGSGVVDL